MFAGKTAIGFGGGNLMDDQLGGKSATQGGLNSDNGKLTRYLSPLGAWSLAFGCAVGWGAFIMPGTTFLPTAGPMGTIIGMLAGTVLMLVIAFNYHYLMNRNAGSGGAFAYTKIIFGNDHGFLCAWFLILTYIAILPPVRLEARAPIGIDKD